MNKKIEIIKRIESISGKYSACEVFTDWIRCCSIAINNACCMIHDKVWEDRERLYIDTMRRYTKEEWKLFPEMLCMLAETLESEMTDVLGQIYMESGMGNKSSGQFFTPYHLSKLCANISTIKPDENGKHYIYEPSCGGGGMIIAIASALKEKGVNYQKDMKVIAQDLDWKGVYMCHLQLSLLGIKAVCVQGNTLTEPYKRGYSKERVLYTPAEMGALL